jgi:hypothetical protein
MIIRNTVSDCGSYSSADEDEDTSDNDHETLIKIPQNT